MEPKLGFFDQAGRAGDLVQWIESRTLVLMYLAVEDPDDAVGHQLGDQRDLTQEPDSATTRGSVRMKQANGAPPGGVVSSKPQ